MPINNYIKWPAERIRQDENNRLVTDVQIAKWDGITIPEAIKNPNALSIQLNGDTAKTYDGSAALNIDITPAGIGAATSDHTHDDAYIKINGSTEGLNFITNSNAKNASTGFVVADGDKEFYIGYIPTCQFRFHSSTNTIEAYECKLKATLTNGISINLPNESKTYNGATAISIDINPLTIGALAVSDVKDWAKADSKPTYTFAEITEKPDTFTPAAHKHKDEDIESISASKITGTISIENIPKAALERCVPVTNDEARFALTTDTVQLGDTVKVENTGLMYLVVDESKLNSEDGYQPYTAAAAASVPWTGVTGKPEKFTPDTHTHTITEVTDLQTTLDGKAAKNHVHDSEKVTNWNNVIVSGAYYAAADATNNPSADAAYSGNVVKGSTIVTQTVVKETIDGDLYKYIRRGQLDTNRTTVTTWGQWQEIQYVVQE